MQLGITLKLGAGNPVDIDKVLEAERLGYSQVWAGEAYGTDAVTPITWVLARTTKIKAGIDKLHGMIAKAGRQPSDVALAYRVSTHGEKLPAKADDGERRLFSGGDQDIIADLRALKEIGVVAADFTLVGPDLEASLATMKRFREDVLNKV